MPQSASNAPAGARNAVNNRTVKDPGYSTPVGAQVYTPQHLWAMAGRGKELAELMVELVAAGAQVFVQRRRALPPRDCRVVMDGSLNLGATDRSEDLVVEVKGRDVALAYAEHWATVRRVSEA